MKEDLVSYLRSHQRLISEILEQSGLDPTARQDDSLDAVLVLAKKNINVFPLSEVKPYWFQLYAATCIAKATHLFGKIDAADDLRDTRNDVLLGEVAAALDNALIIAGGGDEETKEVIHEILRRLNRIFYPHEVNYSDGYTDDEDEKDAQRPPIKKRRLNDTAKSLSPSSKLLPTNLAFVPKISHPISRLDNPSLVTFESAIHKSNTPVILTNTLTNWPALHKWHDATYWLRRTLNGHRLVPIELGQSYTDEGWSQQIMTFRHFLEEFILKGDDAEEIGYLAQHDLFSQIPELRADTGIPDYCYADVPIESEESDRSNIQTNEEVLAETADQSSPVHDTPASKTQDSQTLNDTSSKTNIDDLDLDQDQLKSKNASTPSSPSPPPPPTIHQNIWFGTRTVTPLHHDPYSNILTQIHGTKYIRLYSPKYTANLYPRSTHEPAPHLTSSSSPSHDNPATISQQSHTPQESEQPQTIDMSNTSTIPLWSIEQSPYEDWDELYPGFSSVPYVECLLHEGEALYIPKGWWHYVRGVSAVGIGVSFWW